MLEMARSRVRFLAIFALAAAISGVGGCKPATTHVTVVVGTTIPVCRLHEIVFRGALGWDGAGTPDAVTQEVTWTRGTGAALTSLPGSLYVEARDGQLPTIEFVGGVGTPGFRRLVRVPFLGERRLVVTLNLDPRCLDRAAADCPCPAGVPTCTVSQSCEARGQTCGNDGTCTAIDLAASEFVELGDASVDVVPATEIDDPNLCRDAGATDASAPPCDAH